MPAVTEWTPPSGAQAQVNAVLEGAAEALSGYPVRPMVQACWSAPAGTERLRACRLLDAVLKQWIRRLDDEIASLDPGSRPSLQQLAERTRQTHDALQRLQAAISPLLQPTAGGA